MPSEVMPAGTELPSQLGVLASIKLDERAAAPFWRQLYLQITALMAQGGLSTGQSLPSERDLSEALGISRSTVKRCYDELRNQHQLGGRGRGGSVIQAVPKVDPQLGRLKGFTQEMRELGKVASTKLELREITTNRMIASVFAKPSNTEFLHLARIRLGDGVPMTREVAWYDLSLVPSLADWPGIGSAYDFITLQAGIVLSWADQSCEAVISSAAEDRVFGFATPQPCLLFKRKTFTQSEQLVEYVEGTFRGDAYVYHLRLSA